MEELFNRFLIEYFDKGKKLNLVISKLSFKHEKTFNMYIILYSILFFIYFILIGFIIDYKNSFLTIFLFFYSFILIIIAIVYTLLFFTRNNLIPFYRGIIYAVIFLIGIPFFYDFSFDLLVFEIFAHYFFYIFFIFFYISLIPYIEYVLLNYKNIGETFKIIIKGLFLKLDSHNSEDIINSMKISKKLKSKEVKIYLYKLKDDFKKYGVLLTIYAFLNLVFGISIYKNLYVDYLIPLKENIFNYICMINTTSKGLSILFNLTYIIVVIGLFSFATFFFVYIFFLYLKIHFFDLLYKKIKNTR